MRGYLWRASRTRKVAIAAEHDNLHRSTGRIRHPEEATANARVATHMMGSPTKLSAQWRTVKASANRSGLTPGEPGQWFERQRVQRLGQRVGAGKQVDVARSCSSGGGSRSRHSWRRCGTHTPEYSRIMFWCSRMASFTISPGGSIFQRLSLGGVGSAGMPARNKGVRRLRSKLPKGAANQQLQQQHEHSRTNSATAHISSSTHNSSSNPCPLTVARTIRSPRDSCDVASRRCTCWRTPATALLPCIGRT
jgi:hypothetical protein